MKRFITQKRNILRTSVATLASLCALTFNAHAAVLYLDDFESGLGAWSNTSIGDNKDWTRDFGGTPSSATGPNTGADGSSYYLYLETSSGAAYSLGDTASLVSPIINSTGISVSFAYHMYGSNTGTLALDVLTPGGWTNDVWSLSGQQQQSNQEAYRNATVDLSSYTTSQVRFRATAAGGYRGDIAIDNVVIEQAAAGPEAPAFSSSQIDKPLARENQVYLASIATDASDANGDAITFSKVSGPNWLTVSPDGSLSGTPDTADVGNNVFEVSASDGALSGNALLSIEVIDQFTPIVVAENNFEQGLGDWINAITGDNKNWSLRSGSTPSSGTGPSSGAGGSDQYLYLETSSGQAYTSGDSAAFLSPTMLVQNAALTFDYHMYGSDIGTLVIDVFTDGFWVNSVWQRSGQQQTSNAQAYEQAIVNLAAYQVEQVRFRAIAAGGYRGDIAIDNIKLLSAPEPAPTAPAFSAESFTLSNAQVNTSYSDQVTGLASDANNDPLTFSIVSGPAWLVLTESGQLSGQPGSSDIGVNTFVIQVSDGAMSDTATVVIEVEEEIVLPVKIAFGLQRRSRRPDGC